MEDSGKSEINAFDSGIFKEYWLERCKEAKETLPVVRLCFVGRGRAGKTTTLRQADREMCFPNKQYQTVMPRKIMGLKFCLCNRGHQKQVLPQSKTDNANRCPVIYIAGHVVVDVVDRLQVMCENCSVCLFIPLCSSWTTWSIHIFWLIFDRGHYPGAPMSW